MAIAFIANVSGEDQTFVECILNLETVPKNLPKENLLLQGDVKFPNPTSMPLILVEINLMS